METLKEKLEEFANHSKETVEQLNDEFEKLAPFFLSGGYIKVREDYRVYPTTIEFYFHSEKKDGVKDPIVYHRNNRFVHGNIPYFPMMSLHAHDVGYDITFEDETEQYRASVLIRKYQIWWWESKNNGCWLKWQKDDSASHYDSQKYKFLPCKKNVNPTNTQVTSLKYILNSFPTNGKDCICWEDSKTFLSLGEGIEKGTYRQNVAEYEYKNDGEYEKRRVEGNPTYFDKDKCFRSDGITYWRCLRPWSFSRKEPILIP